MEEIVLAKALKEDVPVLGICRGIQFINAALGGTLYQDIPLQHPSSVNHHQKAPYDIPAHEVAIVEGSPLYDCLSSTQLAVNSCHHQAIRELAPGLEVMACSPDGLVEAVYMGSSRELRVMGSCEALEVVEEVQKMNYKKEVLEVLTQIRFTKNRLAGLTLEMDKEGRDSVSLDEALEALDDVIDILADFVEEE